MKDLPSQSALDTAGTGAERIAELFYAMVVGGAMIWLLVIGLAVYSLVRRGRHPARETRLLVIGGGAVFPTIVLTLLLSYGLSMLPELQRPAPDDSQVIDVAGVRWWWRVNYRLPSGEWVESANEIRLPVDEEVEFHLTSEDVIHSFWIPSLGGKIDMIPGRENRLKLHPTKVGNYRGVCAEFCGAAHAHMAFDVVVMRRSEFVDWLNRQSQSAAVPESEFAISGQDVFLRLGCSACHTIRGTPADGVVGPDLTHFGSRHSIGAGTMSPEPKNLQRWIMHTHSVKPGVEMPAFSMLSEAEIEHLVAYLEQLK